MGYKMTAVEKPKAGQSSVVEIRDDIKSDVEEMYAFLAANPNTEGNIVFDTVKELKADLRQIRAYCASREAGALKFRQLNSKHLPDTHVRFQITADLPENGAREGKAAK